MRTHYSKALIAFMAVLALFLVIESVLIVSYQRRLLESMARQHVEHEMEVMSVAATEALLRKDYVIVQLFLTGWGEHLDDIIRVKATAPNGFVLAQYERERLPEKETYGISREIRQEDRLLVTVDVVADFSSVHMHVGMLAQRLLAGALVLMTALGVVLWYTQKKIALIPMQDEISRRKKAEDDLREARDKLELRVEERTIALREELAERKRAEESVRRREAEIRLLLDSTAEAIYGVDLDGMCTFCNPACIEMLGYRNEGDLLGKKMHDLIHHTHKDGRPYPKEECRVYEAHRSRNRIHVDDEVFWKADGSSFPVEYWSQPVIENDEVTGAVVAFLDITERRRSEDEIERSLREKEVLLREVHHRVKNNMQIISSLLNLQARHVTCQEDVEVLREARNRIRTMALVHEELYKSSDFSQIDYRKYVSSIGRNLYRTYGVETSRVGLSVDVPDLPLPIDTAIPMGLIINEVVSNSIKHAFPDGRKGHIGIAIRVVNGHTELEISDDGVGLPEGFDPATVETMGLQIVRTLAEQQMGGKMDIRSSSGGTVFAVSYIAAAHRESP